MLALLFIVLIVCGLAYLGGMAIAVLIALFGQRRR